MKTLIAACIAAFLALSGTAALAADDKKPATTKAEAALVKPASVKQDAWTKMTDTEKKKAVADAKDASKTAAAPKKVKKGGC